MSVVRHSLAFLVPTTATLTVLNMIAASSMTYCYRTRFRTRKIVRMRSLHQDLEPKHHTAKGVEGVRVKIHVPYILTTRECLNALAVLTPTKKVLYPRVRRMGESYIRSKMW